MASITGHEMFGAPYGPIFEPLNVTFIAGGGIAVVVVPMDSTDIA